MFWAKTSSSIGAAPHVAGCCGATRLILKPAKNAF